MKETQFILDTILEVQPKESAAAEGESTADMAYKLADMIMNRICLNINSDMCHPLHLQVRRI